MSFFDQRSLTSSPGTDVGQRRAWSGSIARLRIYHSTGMVFAYKAPGANANQVGVTDDPNLIRALFLARDNGRFIWGDTYDDGSKDLSIIEEQSIRPPKQTPASPRAGAKPGSRRTE
jgi:hypothetical protein